MSMEEIKDYSPAEMDESPAIFSTYQNMDNDLPPVQLSFLQQTNINTVPPEILVQIFSYLNRQDLCSTARVCKFFRDVAYYKCFWQNMVATVSPIEGDNHGFFVSLAQRGIKKLRVKHAEEKLPELAIVLPNLELLNLSECFKFSSIGISEVFSNHAPNLVSLDLSYCKRLSDDPLSQIAIHCKNLNKLKLNGCRNITDCSLMSIAWGLKKLKVLSLGGCLGITDAGIKHIAGCGSNPSVGNRLLECLVLQDCLAISNTTLEYLSAGFLEHLKALDLCYCNRITDSGLKVLTKMTSLCKLNVIACIRITDVGIQYLCRNSSKLVIHNSLSKISPNGISVILRADLQRGYGGNLLARFPEPSIRKF